MAIYSVGINTSVGVAGTPLVDFVSTAYNSPKFIEIGITSIQAGSGIIGIGKSPVLSSQLGPVNLIAEDPGNTIPSYTTAAVTWSLAPIAPVVYNRRVVIQNASIGQGIVFTFLRGLGIPPSTSLVVWNINTPFNYNVWGVTDE